MSADAFTLLIARPPDLVVLAVGLSGVEVMPGAASGTPRLRAGPDARVRLIFPPQSVAEALLAAPNAAVDARLSGPSALEFAVDAGVELEPTAEGVLRAVAQSGRLLSSTALGDDGSAVELPWGLLGSPVPASADDPVTSDHPAAPLASAAGVVGLWRATLRATHGLQFRPLFVGADLITPTALSGSQRQQIKDAGVLPSLGSDLQLSALGGSGAFRLVARDGEWSHDVALGRDARVRVVSHGMLYPFGHRATLIEAAERVMTDDEAGAVAGMQRTTERIVITQRTREVRRGDFPFDAVEILADAIDFAAHGPQVRRPIPDASGPLQARLAGAVAERDRLEAAISEIPQPVTIEWMVEQGWGSCTDWSVQQDRIRTLTDALANVDENADPSGVAEMRRQLAAARAEAKRLWPLAQEEMRTVQTTVRQLHDGCTALNAGIGELKRQIEAAQAASQQTREVAFLPLGTDRAPIEVSVRCRGVPNDVEFALPLMFVYDFTWTQAEQGEDFSSLSDYWTLANVRGAWGPHGEVPLPGVQVVDLVRAAPAQPGDVHEVGKFLIADAGFDAGYLPRLARIDVRLPAWRMLLPGSRDAASLVYAGAPPEASDGAVADVPLAITPPVALDFTGRADRAGGLAVPRFDVDGVSRQFGAVPTAALPGADPAAWRRVYESTTVLGFPLADLLAGLPKPPAVLPLQLPNGGAGVRFDWAGLRLRENGIFLVPAGDTSGPGRPGMLDVVATLAAEQSETRCTLTKFALVLPPGSPLVRLDFDGLECRTTPGRPPSVAIDNLQVAFLGPLQLLNGLQRSLKGALAEAAREGVVLERTPDGVRAGYALSLPNVTAGMFQLQNVAASVIVDVPFTGRPVTVSLAFARPDNPFRVAVLAFGGGGYAAVTIGAGGLARVDVSLDFGAFLAVDFKVASAEVHAAGAISLTGDGDGVLLVASIRFGGSIDLLGVVSVSVELKLLLTYQDADDAEHPNSLVGRARLVLEVDLLFFSKSLELDTGEWVISGGPLDGPPEDTTPAVVGVVRPHGVFADGAFMDGGLDAVPGRAPGAGGVALLTAPPLTAAAARDDAGRRRWRAYQTAFAEDFVA